MSESRAWSWRHAILKSSLPATTRHVLLTVSCYMNELGDGCYPTQADLVKATGLSERAIREHLDKAETEGWIRRREHGFRGQKWRNHEYFAAWPDTQDVEKGAAPDAGPFSEGAARDAETCGTSVKKVRHHVPPTSPRTLPITSPPSAQARGEGEERFNILWGSWPPHHLPDSRDTAWKLFAKLSEVDRAKALAGAPHYLKAMICRSKPPRMVTYLRDRIFADFHDGPEIDSDGDFVIRSGSPEWGAWLGDIRRQYGERQVAAAASRKFVVRKTRWPADLPLAHRVTNLAPLSSETVADSRSAGGSLL